MVKTCSKCGGTNADFAVICIDCGEKLEEQKNEEKKIETLNETLENKQKKDYIPPELLYSKYYFKIDKKILLLIALFCMTLIIILSTFFLPWYSTNIKLTGSIEYVGSEIGFPPTYVESNMMNDLTLTEIRSTIGGKSSLSLFQSQWFSGSTEYADENELKNPINNTFYLTILLIIVTILIIIFLAVMIFKKINKNIVKTFMVILITLSIITLIYFAVAIPNAISKNVENVNNFEEFGYDYSFYDFTDEYGGFFGSFKTTMPWSEASGISSSSGTATIETSWGPSYGWYLIIISIILIIICLFIYTKQFGKN